MLLLLVLLDTTRRGGVIVGRLDSARAGREIVDVGDPTEPWVVGGCATPASAMSLCRAGDYVYVALDMDNYSDLGVIDVRDPENPRFVRACGLAGWFTALQAVDNLLFIADAGAGLRVFDLSNPTNPVARGTFTAGGGSGGLQVVGRQVFMAASGRIWVIDATDPDGLVEIAYSDAPGAEGVFVPADGAARPVFAACGGNGLLVIPSIPKVQFTFEAAAVASVALTVEATTDVADPDSWVTLLTTNTPATPFWFTDTNIRSGVRYYRVHQP